MAFESTISNQIAKSITRFDHNSVKPLRVSKPELLSVFGEVSFSGSTPEPGEMDGADASNFAHTEDLPFPVLYRGAVTQAMALPKSPGQGSPETMPEYSFNFHCAPESRWFKLCLATVRTHAECAAILYHPAKAMGQELTGAAADFEGFYT